MCERERGSVRGAERGRERQYKKGRTDRPREKRLIEKDEKQTKILEGWIDGQNDRQRDGDKTDGETGGQ